MPYYRQGRLSASEDEQLEYTVPLLQVSCVTFLVQLTRLSFIAVLMLVHMRI